MARRVSGPTAALSGLFPVDNALPGSPQGPGFSAQLLCPQNILKFLYAAAQQEAFVSELS